MSIVHKKKKDPEFEGYIRAPDMPSAADQRSLLSLIPDVQCRKKWHLRHARLTLSVTRSDPLCLLDSSIF